MVEGLGHFGGDKNEVIISIQTINISTTVTSLIKVQYKFKIMKAKQNWISLEQN